MKRRPAGRVMSKRMPKRELLRRLKKAEIKPQPKQERTDDG